MTLVKSTLGIKKEPESNGKSKSLRTEPKLLTNMSTKLKNPSQNASYLHQSFPKKKEESAVKSDVSIDIYANIDTSNFRREKIVSKNRLQNESSDSDTYAGINPFGSEEFDPYEGIVPNEIAKKLNYQVGDE